MIEGLGIGLISIGGLIYGLGSCREERELKEFYKKGLDSKLKRCEDFTLNNTNIINEKLSYDISFSDVNLINRLNPIFEKNEHLETLDYKSIEELVDKVSLNKTINSLELFEIFINSLYNLESIVNTITNDLLNHNYFNEQLPKSKKFKKANYYTMLVVHSLYHLSMVLWEDYKNKYYNSEEFLTIKQEMKDYVTNCNNLNKHIKELAQVSYNFRKNTQYRSERTFTSAYNYTREIDNSNKDNVVYVNSLSTIRNAQNDKFKYFFKYFNVESSEETLSIFERMLNNYVSIQEGKLYHTDKVDEIKEMISENVPYLINIYDFNRISKEIEFDEIPLNDINFMTYGLQYVSPKGVNKDYCPITLDIETIENMIQYMDSKIKYKKSAKYQRSLMTKALRTKIKERDNYTCKKCGISVYDEPHLLLEIDHIIPVSKGGQTSEDNLQCLCWQCNRSKSNKVDEILSIYRD